MNRISWRVIVLFLVATCTLDLRSGSGAVPTLLQSVPVSGMIAYWNFEDPIAGSTVLDRSLNGNTGTLMNGATLTSSTVPTIPLLSGNTQSLQLVKSSNSFVNVPDAAILDITGSYTCAAWIRHTLNSPDQYGIVEKFNDTPIIERGYSFRLTADEYLGMANIPAGGPSAGPNTAPRPIGDVAVPAWHHVAGVYDMSASNIIRLYEDGVLDATTQTGVPPPAAGTAALHIGRDYGQNSFEGQIDEVRIYNRALVVEEIAVLMNGQPAPTGLIVTGGPNLVTVDWTAPAPQANVTVTYTVQQALSATGPWTVVASNIPYGTTIYQDVGLTGGTTYFYRVFAVSVMESNPLGPLSATPFNSVRFNDHEEGLHDGKCSCGSAASLPRNFVWIAAFAAALFLALRRRTV